MLCPAAKHPMHRCNLVGCGRLATGGGDLGHGFWPELWPRQERVPRIGIVPSTSDLRPRDARLLAALFAFDLFFVLLHALHVATPWLPDRMFSLEQDHGYSELFQYTKEVATGWLLLRVARASRVPVHGALAAVLFYLVADDAFELHEALGARIVQRFGLVQAMHLRAADIGELLAGLTIAAGLLVLLALAWWRSGAAARVMAVDIGLLLGLLMFFGVFVDALHAALSALPIGEVFTVIEEGGELATLSVLLWYARRCAVGAPLPWSHGQWLMDRAMRLRVRLFGRPV